MKNALSSWKSTSSGLIAAFFLFVAFKPQYFPPILNDIAAFMIAGGLASLGINTKDFNKK